MKSRDILEAEKKKIVETMNQAIQDGDAQAFSGAFAELCQKIEDNVLGEARALMGQQDAEILAQRGVRQLTGAEKEYYQKVIDAMKSADPKQALSSLDVVMPETIIDSVFEDLTTNHPLLSKIKGTTVSGLTRMMMNTNGDQKAAWGKLTGKIIEELSSGFKEVDVTQDKLSAFLPISRAMLDLGPNWLDRYIREVLSEAYANGLEYGIVNGTGKDMPIGMMRQVGDGVTVTAGEYPEKNAVAVTQLDMVQMGNITSIMARDASGKPRTVRDLIILVNPVDYWKKYLPATRVMTPDGAYVSVLPVPAEAIQCAAVPEGKAVYGIASQYFLGVGMAKNGKIEYSDEYHFLEDERVYLIKGYANGFAKDNNAFVVLDISKLEPARYRIVTEAQEHVDNANLSDLRIGGLVLTPSFASETLAYSVETEAATNTITAYPETGTAEIAITVNDAAMINGSRAAWKEGSNTVKVVVKDGELTKTYTVTVNRTAGG